MPPKKRVGKRRITKSFTLLPSFFMPTIPLQIYSPNPPDFTTTISTSTSTLFLVLTQPTPPMATIVLVALLSLLVSIQKGDAHDLKIGSSGDWSIASAPYTTWAERARFSIGDTILFNYDGSKDSLLLVSQADYNNCNTASPIEKHNDGHTVITLERSGPHYFISGVPENCKKNEKVTIVVMADRSQKATSESPFVASSNFMIFFCLVGVFACFFI
ncbi:unnamed protein product [Lactuca virosa]|uniref:Phytocyanin domain-containing protein n=1 Tax=Lactuca virosa TaxID=75947 RepID=A0AAU9MRC0_9ASTR|nr:unnamed protein product [Lactuca virosa]